MRVEECVRCVCSVECGCVRCSALEFVDDDDQVGGELRQRGVLVAARTGMGQWRPVGREGGQWAARTRDGARRWHALSRQVERALLLPGSDDVRPDGAAREVRERRRAHELEQLVACAQRAARVHTCAERTGGEASSLTPVLCSSSNSRRTTARLSRFEYER